MSLLDVTDQRGTAAQLQQQAELLDQTHDAILIWSLGGTIRYWNRGAEELYGWSREEALGRISHQLLKTRHGIPFDEFLARLRRDRHWLGEVIHTTRDGRELVVDSRYTVREDVGGKLLVLETNRDITERKRTEEQLQALADSIPQLAWIANPKGEVAWFNRRWYEYTGAMPEETVGWGWQRLVDPEFLPAVLERWRASSKRARRSTWNTPCAGPTAVSAGS